MPDDFDSLPEDQGTDLETSLEPSTVGDGSTQDLLGSDAAQSDDDLGGTPPDDEEDSQPSGDFLDEADITLLRYQPEQGIERINERVNDFVKKQNKAYTRKMTKIAREYKPVQQKAQQFDTLVQALRVINQTDPEWVKGANARLQAAAQGKYSEWGKSMNNSSDDPPLRSKSDLVSLIRNEIRGAVGELKNQYGTDQAAHKVDSVLARLKNDRLHGLRSDLVQALTEHPTWTVSQALGSIDPDLLVQLKQKPAPSPVQRSLNDFTMQPPKKFKNSDDAFFAALAKHGDPDLIREP